MTNTIHQTFKLHQGDRKVHSNQVFIEIFVPPKHAPNQIHQIHQIRNFPTQYLIMSSFI
jgi:hypothetical protein